MGAVTKCQANRELRGFRDIDLPDHCNVAVVGTLKLPVEFQIILQVLPTVGDADVPARGLDESCVRTHREIGPSLPREEDRLARYPQPASGITPSPDFQMGCQQRIHSQSSRPFRVGFNPRVYEHARLMRVRYDFLYKSIPAFAVDALDVIAESVFLNIRNRALQVALLFVEEGLPIRDEELHIANLWTVDRGVVDFVQNAVRQGEPDTAAS